MGLLSINKIAFFSSFILSLFLLVSCSKDKKEYYENGSLKYECLVNDSNITVCRYFSETGVLKEQVRFDPSKNERIKNKYYSNSTLENSVTMVHDSIISDKSYDRTGMLINEFGKNKQCKFYQYYKDRKLHCINFMHVVSNVPDYSSDSAYIFSHSTNKLLLKWHLVASDKGKQQVVTKFDQAGMEQKIDTLKESESFLQIVNETLKEDTIQLYYQPVM